MVHITMHIIWNLSILVQKFKSIDKVANEDQNLLTKKFLLMFDFNL